MHTHETKKFLVDDYFRYTKSSLDRIFIRSGFSKVEIEPMGGLFFGVAEFLGFVIVHRTLRLPVFAFFMMLEIVYARMRPGVSAQRYPLTYFVVAQK